MVHNGQATDQLLSPHLAQRGEVDVAEAGVPRPRFVVGPRRQADGARDGDVEGVEAPRAPGNLGEKALVLVEHSHHAVLDEHLEPAFVELADRNDVGGESREVVDVRQRAVLAVLAVEEDDAGAVDAGDRAVPESNRSGDGGVQIGEGRAGPGHVVGCPGVQDPALRIPVLVIIEGGVDLLLDEV